MSEIPHKIYWQIKLLGRHVGVKFYERNIIGRKMFNVKFTKKLMQTVMIESNTRVEEVIKLKSAFKMPAMFQDWNIMEMTVLQQTPKWLQ